MRSNLTRLLLAIACMLPMATIGCESDDVYSTTTIEMTNESDAEMVDQGDASTDGAMVEPGEMRSPGEMIVE
jgi:hypothetical protein